MAEGKVQRIFVGSDRVALNGDFANKIGTYSLAVLAHYHRVPFYVVAPNSTIDLNARSGQDIPVEEQHLAHSLGVFFCGLVQALNIALLIPEQHFF